MISSSYSSPSRDEELNAGLIAYAEVQAFQSPSSARRRRLELFGVFAVLFLFVAIFAFFGVHSRVTGANLGTFTGLLFVVLFLGGFVRVHRKYSHLKNLEALHSLEAKYGPSLPWLEVERQAAAIAEIQREAALAPAPAPLSEAQP